MPAYCNDQMAELPHMTRPFRQPSVGQQCSRDRCGRDAMVYGRTRRGPEVRPPVQYRQPAVVAENTCGLLEYKRRIIEFMPQVGHEHEICT